MTNILFRTTQGQEHQAIIPSPWSQDSRSNPGFAQRSQQSVRFTPYSGGLILMMFCCLVLSGCGASYVVKGATGASTSTGTITPSPNTVDFGTVSVGQSANTKIDVVNQGTEPVEISDLTLSGSSFSVDGEGNLPVTLPAGSTMSFKVHFNPQTDESSTGQVTIASNSTTSPTALVKLQGKGKHTAQVTPSSLSCNSGSVTGAATDACTVTLSGAAGSGGLSVTLTSNNAAVTVPGSVTVPANATTVSFNATVSAVSAAQSATLTASANGGSAIASLQLNAVVPILSVSATSLSFGSHAVNTATTKSVTLTSTGTAPVTIRSAALSGTGFTMAGVTFPVTLNPSQTATLNVTFDPASAGAATGQITIASNSSTNPSAVISLSGTGTASTPVLSSFSCGSSSMTGAGTDACTVTLSAAAASAQSVSLSSNNAAVTVPSTVTVPANSTTAGFTATVLSFSSSQTVTLTASAGGATKSFGLQLNASTPTLNALTCQSGTMTTSGTDACTVTLSAAAGSGGQSVSLSSSSAVVAVPASITIPANSTSAGFTATVLSFSSSQAVTLTGSAGGVTKSFGLQLNASIPTLSVSTTSVNFGNVTVGQTAKQSVTLTSSGTAPVTISAVSIVGSLFTASGVAVPLTLNPGQTATLNLSFYADHVSNFTGTLTLSNSSSQGSIAINMSGAGTAAAGTLSALSCGSGSMTAAGTDACTVSLSGAAPAGGLTVSLASNNAAVAVPASVTVAANATSASFSATVSTFSTVQTVTLTASAGGITQNFALQLNPTGTSTLSINATSIAFGNVVLNNPATQTVILTSTGTAAVTVKAATVSGAGFTVSGATFPVSLNPNQSVTLSVQFDPTTAGAATGQLTITSSSSTNATAVVGLSGTGTPHEVNLSWDAPASSSDPVAGYNVYRSADGGNTYQEVASISAAQTTYVDNTVASGQAYDYVVKSFDAEGADSKPSNQTSVTIP